MERVKKICNNIIKFRYLLFLILFIFCVLLKLHGSSIGIYNLFIEDKINPNIKQEIFGESRAIRSDEWMVHTPYYFSQSFNKFEKYSHQMSIGGQNMILGYNAPVKDITTISKPFTWGYIFFGNEYGLSWYWCLKLFLLILVSFELSMILTKNNKKISIFGAFIISFAPPLQWWFVPHMTDVFFWAMTVTTLAYHFFIADTKWKKILFTILLPISCIGYSLALFPSLQVPLAMLSLALIIALLIRDKEKITFTKKEWPRIAFVLLVIISILGYFIITSLNDLKLLMHTVYPGERVSTGNDSVFADIFTDVTTLFLPYKTITYSNNCEASRFIHLAPLFLMTYIMIKNKIKTNDLFIGKVLFISILIELFFMLIGFPTIVAKITMFKYINRMYLVYGFTALLFTLWSIYTINKYKIKIKKKTIKIILIIFTLCYLTTIDSQKITFYPIYYYIIEIIYISIMSYLFLKGKQTTPLIMYSLLIIIASVTINPISQGTSAITNHKISREITKISNKDDGYWLVNGSNVYANFALANGAKVINATNFYPDYDKWKLLDPKKENDEYYNRYANMSLELIKGKTNYNLVAPDHLSLKLDYKDIKKLKIKYILTLNDIEDELKINDYQYKLLFTDDQIEIYEIK